MQMASVVLCAFIHDGLPSFYNRQENCQLLFPVPISDMFKQDDSQDERFLRLGRLQWSEFKTKMFC